MTNASVAPISHDHSTSVHLECHKRLRDKMRTRCENAFWCFWPNVPHRTTPPAPRPRCVSAEHVLTEKIPGLLEKYLGHHVSYHPFVELLFSGSLMVEARREGRIIPYLQASRMVPVAWTFFLASTYNYTLCCVCALPRNVDIVP